MTHADETVCTPLPWATKARRALNILGVEAMTAAVAA
jgi:hypothetical protein